MFHDVFALHDCEGCSRLIHDDDLRVPINRPRDCDRLPLATRQAGDRSGMLRNLTFDSAEETGRFLADHAIVDERQYSREPPDRFASQKDVGAHREVVCQREILVDRLDSPLSRVARSREIEPFPG